MLALAPLMSFTARWNFYSSSQMSRNMMITNRLATVAAPDFLCWFPVGLLGVLASSGVTIPSEVNVAMAIFLLPVNSAINPYLYTLNLILERRQKARAGRLQRLLDQARQQGRESESGTGHSAYAEDEANRIQTQRLTSHLLSRGTSY